MQSAMRASLYRLERTSERLPIGRPSTLRGRDGGPVDVRIEDLSATGCRLSTRIGFCVDEQVMIGLPGVGMRGARVIWAAGHEAGFAFDAPVSLLEVEEARVSDPVVQVDFRPFPGRPSAAAPATAEKAIAAQSRLGIILASGLGAWALVSIAGALSYFLIV